MSTFTAATWNVFNGTDPKILRPILDSLIKTQNVTLLLMQEMSNPAQRHMVEAAGLRVIYEPTQYVIAYVPERWELRRSRPIQLSPTTYYTASHHHEMHSDAVLAVLRDKHTKKLLKTMSYHTPANVQVPASQLPKARLQILKESAATWRRVNEHSKHVDGILFGGDDNVDERLKHGPWDFLLEKATGLKQIQAPEPTHGKVRRLDDFRIRGLRPLNGAALPGGGDHKIHVRTFGWTR